MQGSRRLCICARDCCEKDARVPTRVAPCSRLLIRHINIPAKACHCQRPAPVALTDHRRASTDWTHW
jgi:hypothetical protein